MAVAPCVRARSRASGPRAAATTSAAPSATAACTATWPTTPPAPRTSTRSPARSPPRQVSAIQAATDDSPSAAAVGVLDAFGQRHDVVLGHGCHLGEAAVTGPHPGVGVEPDAGAGRHAVPGLDDADTLDAGDVGQCRRTEVRRAARAQQVERGDRSSCDANEAVSLRSCRCGPSGQLRGVSVRGEHRRSHRAGRAVGHDQVLMSAYGSEKCSSALAYCSWKPSGSSWSRSNIAMNRVRVRNGWAPSANSAG